MIPSASTALRSDSNRSIVVIGNYENGPITAEPCRAKTRPLRPRRSCFAPAKTRFQRALVEAPKGQTIEVHVVEATVLGAVYGGDKGEVGGKNYPMAKKQHGLEFLREKAHLRPRSKVFSSAMRVRHAMAFATHKVYLSKYLFGEMFRLTNCLHCDFFAHSVLQRARICVRAHPSDHRV